MSKANICVYGLAKQFTDDIAKELAKKLDVFYANFDKIFEFELIDLDNVEKLCGKEYFAKKEHSLLKRLCSYDNTLININYALLNVEKNLKVLKDNNLIIYLRLAKDRFLMEIDNDNLTKTAKELNIDMFEDRDNICLSHADIVVECQNLGQMDVLDQIIVELLKYYE